MIKDGNISEQPDSDIAGYGYREIALYRDRDIWRYADSVIKGVKRAGWAFLHLRKCRNINLSMETVMKDCET